MQEVAQLSQFDEELYKVIGRSSRFELHYWFAILGDTPVTVGPTDADGLTVST